MGVLPRTCLVQGRFNEETFATRSFRARAWRTLCTFFHKRIQTGVSELRFNPRRGIEFAIFLVTNCTVLVPVQSPVLAQSKDPFAGTWLLARGKSDFEPPSNFFKRTMIIESVDNGHKCIVRTITDRQQTVEYVYQAQFDGKDTPTENSPFETISLKRIDANTIERAGKIKGQVVETSTMKLSEDGKILMLTTKGSFEGQVYSSTQVFNRQ